MKACVKLELIWDNYFWAKRRKMLDWETEFSILRRMGPDKSPSWIAQLLPGMRRKYLRGVRDYSEANSTGSKGIFEYFPVGDGVYEINNRYAVNKVRHYFIEVKGAAITEITREDAERWLEQNSKNTQDSMSYRLPLDE